MVTHVRYASMIKAAGNKPKVIEEFTGRINTQTEALSIAHMKSLEGWIEPGRNRELTKRISS